MLYAYVDRAKCNGYGLCNYECPELFKLDENGFAYVEAPEVPDALVAKARAAEGVCPERAISVRTEPG